MYIRITPEEGEAFTLTALKSLRFAPEIDLSLSTLPVDQFTAEAVTDSFVPIGAAADLYDDLNQLWAAFVITRSERPSAGHVSLTAKSRLCLLDSWECRAKMYESQTLQAVVQDILTAEPARGVRYSVRIDINSAYTARVIDGYCPQQTARERLQWLCFVTGLRVVQCFDTYLRLEPAPDSVENAPAGTLIPLQDTYWKPTLAANEEVVSLTVTSCFDFRDDDPAEDDPDITPEEDYDYTEVTDANGKTWWFAKADWVFENQDASAIGGRSVSVTDVTVTGDDADLILRRMARAYFRRDAVTLEAINNRQYLPGDRVRFYTDEATICAGIVKSCDFAFGCQAKARMVISSDLAALPTGTVRIVFKKDGQPIGERDLVLPEDEPYDIDIDDIVYDDEVVKPVPSSVSGVASTGISTHAVDCVADEVYTNADGTIRAKVLHYIQAVYSAGQNIWYYPLPLGTHGGLNMTIGGTIGHTAGEATVLATRYNGKVYLGRIDSNGGACKADLVVWETDGLEMYGYAAGDVSTTKFELAAFSEDMTYTLPVSTASPVGVDPHTLTPATEGGVYSNE